VRIGLLLPPEEAEADSLRQGAEIAVALANRTASVPVELVIRGRPGQWGDDGVEAGRMVLDDTVDGLIAPPGGMPTHLALQVAGRTATPVVSLCGDSSVTGAGVPWSVRIVPSTTDEAQALMAGLSSADTRWAALVAGDRGGREVARDLTHAAAAAQRQLDSIIVFDPTIDTPTTLRARLPDPQPNALLLWLEAEPAARALRHLRAIGFQGIIAGPGRWRSERFQNSVGGTGEGLFVARPRSTPDAPPVAAQFEASYREAYGQSPDLTAAMACDAVSLLLHLKSSSGTAPMHRQFPITETVPGVTGALQFDRLGNRLLTLELTQFRDGAWTTPELPAPGVTPGN